MSLLYVFFFKPKTAYEMRISDWSSDVCSSDLALNGRNVERRRQIVDDRVEQRLDALVLERRAAKDRDERLHQRALADQRLELGDVGDGAFEIGFHRVVVLFDGEIGRAHV